MNRRALLYSGVTAALARTWGIARASQAGPADLPALGGRVSRDAGDLASAATDFGRIVHHRPRAVVTPASAADVASLLRWASAHGVKVAAHGQGHSTYGRAMAADGIVLDMRALAAIHDVQPDRMIVDAGASWSSVLDAALARGLTPPVLTNYLGLSVGGTIAVGGVGASSSRFGMLTDNVLALDVVTGMGREVRCSPASNPDLFDAVRAGLGRFGVVTRATLRLEPAPERVRRVQLWYRDLRALSADQRRVLAGGRFDQLQGAVLPDPAGGWRYQLDGAAFYSGDKGPDDERLLAGLLDDRKAAIVSDLSYRDDAFAFAKLEQALRDTGQWSAPKPWLMTFLPAGKAEQAARDILGMIDHDDLGPFGRITFYPLATRPCRTPLFRLPDDSIAFVFNVVRMPPTNEAAETERMVARHAAIYDYVRKAGGVLYPVSAVPLTPADWKEHFGARWAMMREAARRHDPAGVLTPGYDVF